MATLVVREPRHGMRIHYPINPGEVVQPRPSDSYPKRCGSWDDFKRRFAPIENPLTPAVIMIETTDMVSCPPEHVWTIVDDDHGGLVLCPGWRVVNRIAYVVARNPRVDHGATPYKPYRY